MKKVICAILALLLVFSLAGCSGEKPEEVVERVTQAIKEGKIESVRGNIDLSALDKLFPASEEESKRETDETLLSDGQETSFPVEKTLDKITVKILSSEKDGDNATVKAECTAVDLTEFLKGYMQKSMEMALDFTKDDAAKDEELNKYATDYLSQEDVPLKTTTVDIKLTKSDKTWKITSTTEYLDSLTGGYLSTMQALAESFGG
uniref:hypothetical protein n=1 Tax=Candidatus Fimivicinus sp. TaxID=3056640 RepID=UPI003FEFE600